jgi:hypothetical protein
MATVLHTHGNGRTASRLPDRTTADTGHPTLSPTTVGVDGSIQPGATEDARILIADSRGVRVTVHETRPKAHAGYSKRDGVLWLSHVTVERPNKEPVSGWYLYCPSEGAGVDVWSKSRTLRGLNSEDRLTLFDAMWLSWLRAFRHHPARFQRTDKLNVRRDDLVGGRQ